MASPSYSRSLASAFKRLKVSPSTAPIEQIRRVQQSVRQNAEVQEIKRGKISVQKELDNLRLPKAVQATYLKPLRRSPTYHIPCADLQLRSYSIRNLDLFTDFAMRAAYFLNLPAKGPTPLRRIVERWTVPRSNFVHKKSQENFERITLRRWIRITDGHPETVAIWLAFLRKHQYYGVGLKANVYEHTGLDVAKDLDDQGAEAEEDLGSKVLRHMPLLTSAVKDIPSLEEAVFDQPFKGALGASSAMGGAVGVPDARKTMPKVRVEPPEKKAGREESEQK